MKIPLTVGVSVTDPGTDVVLDGARFNRHTFWCGQSGSGKTYALGVVLERLLLESGLPLLLLDPNSDFVGLGIPRDTAPSEAAMAISEADIRVFRPRDETHDPIVVRYVDMDLASRAAVLRLDPIADIDEFNALRNLESEFGPQDTQTMVSALGQSSQPERIRLLKRIENLGVLDWDVWARGAEGVEEKLDSRPDATVVDLGGFHHPDEPAAAALAILDRVWRQRQARKPLLIVIDEAHNLCPPEPDTPLLKAVTARLIQIAAEGRKYGLWLLLSTQRPSKIHPQVLSQCDNVCIMKTNSPIDIDHLARYFGGIPRQLLERIPSFTQGQSLFAGSFVPEATIAQMTDRLTQEGGGDVSVPSTRQGL